MNLAVTLQCKPSTEMNTAMINALVSPLSPLPADQRLLQYPPFPSGAQIFARNITQVTSVHDVQELMRYNNFQHDPISQNDPMNGIMSRADLM